METKSTWKTEIALFAGIVLAVVPVILEYVPKESAWVPLLGALMSVATFIGARQLRVASDNRSAAIIEASKANPSQP